MPQNGESANSPTKPTFMSEVQILKKKPIPEEPPHWSDLLRTLKVEECFPLPQNKRVGVQSLAFRVARATGKKFTIRQVVNSETGATEVYCWRVK